MRVLCRADNHAMSDVAVGMTVTRWRRYGHDRLYVTRSDGAKVGWYDLKNSHHHPEAPELNSALTTAVRGWLDEHPDPVPSPSAPSRQPTDPPAPRPWLDLTANLAASQVQAQADAKRQAAPLQSLVDRALGVHTEERSWRVGAAGEKMVALQLVELARRDPAWGFLHSVPVGNRGADIDHVVVGPGGVFTINAKHHRDAKIWVGGNTLLVNGHRQPYIRNARYEAERAARKISAACGFPVNVHGLVVPVNAADISVRSQPEGVSVVGRYELVRWFLRLGVIHSPAVVCQIFDSMRRSTTWQ